MRRLSIDPSSIEAIVCSHGHFDHTAGIEGLIRVLGRTGLPVLIHPHFWRRRRILLPGRDPLAWLGESWQPDPLVLDDQALIVNVAGRGIVVITGCGHAGIVNTARYAQRLTGGQPLYALLGGFHLNGPLFEPLIPRVLDDLAALDPAVLVPAHCTGWRAQHALGTRFPGVFAPSVVGTRFRF